MKILHIAPSAVYNEGWGFHENLLPKYHAKLGHEVTLITNDTTYVDGQVRKTDCVDRVLPDGVRLIRLEKKVYRSRLLTSMRAHLDVYGLLEQLRPELVFVHGLLGSTIEDVVRYKKKIDPHCVIVRDNHMDENNMPKRVWYRHLLLRAYDRRLVRKTMPYVSCVFGVTPWRVDFARRYYKVPEEKLELLVMGADDEMVDLRNRAQIRQRIRQQYGVTEKEFLIVTGGKIDEAKNIHLLMEAVKGMEEVKLLVFGTVLPQFKERFDQILHGADGIIHIGWVPSEKVYDYFFAADLVMFPGGHSVMWEQACASKVPCVFRRWDMMDHVDNGGNSEFLDPVTVESIREKIVRLHHTPRYAQMKAVAESDATDIFRYSMIAARSLERVTGT